MTRRPLAPSAAQQPLLHASGLRLAHNRRVLLETVSLEIAPGDVIRLAGENATGKTSLLRVLAGLDRPRAGYARAHVPRALVPEKAALAPGTSVIGWLESMRRLRRGDPVDWSDHVEQSGLPATVLGLASRQLSKGMAQRVALVEALTGSARLLLLDEPFSGLDTAGRSWLEQQITSQANEGAGLVVIDHTGARAGSPTQARQLRIAGRELCEDPPSSTADKPQVVIDSRLPDGRARRHVIDVGRSDGVLRELLEQGHHIDAVGPP